MLAGMHIPRVVADWAECTWLYDALMCVTTSPTQRTIARQLRELGVCPQGLVPLHSLYPIAWPCPVGCQIAIEQ